MEDLPAEILQHISWFSLNPELYLVSKKINLKLPPLRQFEMDVASLLFCDRVGSESAWANVDPFPWQTSEAVTSDFKFSLEERRELQQPVLTQSWFSPQKFRHIATRLCKLWIDHQWISADMSAETRKALQDYLESGLFEGPRKFYDNQGNMLRPYGCMEVYKRDSREASTKAVVEVLCYPLKLFVEPRSPSKLGWFNLIWLFMPNYQTHRPVPPVSYPQSALRKALDSVVVDGDVGWFKKLFPLAVGRGVDIPVHQLVHEVSAALLSGRQWNLMRYICNGTTLPGDYLESCIAPAVTQAISDGDSGARDFQQWIECEGWLNIQSRTVYPEW